MPKITKWVKPSYAHQPLSQVAAKVIRQRLSPVWDYALLAAKRWDEDAEFVHQMRVATRRSAAALRLFAELLPRKKTKRIRRRLKRLRTSSGEARDLDVLYDRLRRQMKLGQPAQKTTLDALRKLRAGAQEPMSEQVEALAADDFPRAIDDLCQRVRWRQDGPEPTYAQAARGLLAAQIDKFLLAARDDLDDSEKLHALRIAGKQLRYAMELLSGAFGPQFRQDHYEPLREIQDKLGEINDHAAAQSRFARWAGAVEGEAAERFAALAGEEGRFAATRLAEFRAWWTGGRQREFEENLRRAVTED